jgi:hypothetical protein
MAANNPKLDPREEHFLIAGPHPHRKLFLRFLPALNRDGATRRPVLYVHGFSTDFVLKRGKADGRVISGVTARKAVGAAEGAGVG